MASLAAVVDEVVQAHLDLAWGWWTELGVPGAPTRGMEVALHPEALLVFSASLTAHDARLRDGVIGWVLGNERHVGARQVLAVANRLPAVPDGMADFAATLRAAGGPKMPGHGVGVPVMGQVQVLERPLRLERPPLALLRVRMALGHHARSEVLAVLAGGQRLSRTHADLSRYVASTPRNVRLALDDLVQAGVVDALRGPGGHRYGCRQVDALVEWLGPLPELPPWVTFLPAFTALRRALTASGSDVERAVNAMRMLDHHADDLAWLDLPALPRVDGRDQAMVLARWLLDTSPIVAGGVRQRPVQA